MFIWIHILTLISPPVEVRLARDNNGPDLGTRHVSVLLSSCVIDRVGLLSAAWIHSRASPPQHSAVTGHKEGSISTAPRSLLPRRHAPSKITPSTARERIQTRIQKQRGGRERPRGDKRYKRETGKNNPGGKGWAEVRVDSGTPGTRERRQGFTSHQDAVAAAQPHVNAAASAAEHT